MNEDDDFLSFSLRQAAANLALKRGDRLFVGGNGARRAAIAGGTHHGRIRNLGKPPNFLNSRELHLFDGPVKSGSTRISIDPKLIVRERSDP